MHSFYNPRPDVSFLALRTNTQMFKPPKSAFARPSIAGIGRQPHALPLQIAPTFDPEVPQAIIEEMMGKRAGEEFKAIGDSNYPRQGGNLIATAPEPNVGVTFA